MRALSILAALVAAASAAHAQQPTEPTEPTESSDAGPAEPAEPASPLTAPEEIEKPPDLWTAWDVQPAPGERFLEDKATVRALLEDDMALHRALNKQARRDLEEAALRFGYQLVDLEVVSEAGEVRAILSLAPRLVIRRVEIDVDQWSRLSIKEELARLLRLRVGETLDIDEDQRSDRLREEELRLAEFLQDEGFFEARVRISVERSGTYGAVLTVKATLGPDYHVGDITIKPDGPLALPRSEIRGTFHHCQWRFFAWCLRRQRFTRGLHQADLQRLTETYQRRGYPAARVRSDYDTKTSFDRATKKVDFTVRIDERRRLAVEFEGNDPSRFADDVLTRQLTFDDSGSADDLEVAASALAIQRFYQRAGYFDAAVSWERERKRVDDRGADRSFDLIRYRIDAGRRRVLRGVEIVGEEAIAEDQLRAVLQTRAAPGTFRVVGGTSAATTEMLEGDRARLLELYRSRGYLQAEVTVSASPTRASLDDAATAAAVLAAETAPDDLWIRFTIDEGARHAIARVDVAFVGPHVATEQQVLDQLGIAAGDPVIVADLQIAGTRLRDWYWRLGRPRAEIRVTAEEVAGHGMVATYTIEEHQELRIGKVVVRGNFRTDEWVIREEVGLREGDLLTDDLLTTGRRRLNATGLFAVSSVDPINLDETRSDRVHVVVRVEEEHDVRAYVDAELGYSDQKALYLKGAPVFPNLLGNGVSISTGLTLGVDVVNREREFEAEELTIRWPRWVTRRWLGGLLDPDLELSAFRRIQDTERFGELETYSGTIALAKNWSRPAADHRDARLFAAALRYDFRLRFRNEESLRLAGNNATVERAQVQNRTGIVGVAFTWDQRVDERGNLNPLAPHHGFKLEASAGYASEWLLGQDDFIKLGGIGQWITQLSPRVQLKLEGRYDHGIPLRGAVLLPEVERFFAGGDETVRGFAEDRVATEIIERPVPPFGGVTQVEVLPAGGNIRALGSVDLQVRLWKLGSVPVASALFVDAGLITNNLASVELDDVRPSVGVALARLLTPFGGLSLEWATPMLPREHDPALGRLHFLVALRY